MRSRILLFLAAAVIFAASPRVSALEGPSPQRLSVPGGVTASPVSGTTFTPLPFGSVRPTGFLLEQMRLDAAGLAGDLGSLFSDVGPQSGWRGGGGDSWERGPYYARGLVALALATGDPRLKAKARDWVEWALASQHPDGSFGPSDNADWWPRMIVMQYLTWWAEGTGDERVLPFLSRALAYQARVLKARPLREWARFRAADNLEPLRWVYQRTGDASLLDLSRALAEQSYDWCRPFLDGKPLSGGSFIEHRHGVNLAQGLKFPALAASLGVRKESRASLEGVRLLESLYGQSFGVFTADETVDDPAPGAGTELCATVEYLHSLEILMELTGDPSLGDRIEKAAYNALPASFTPDYKGYQYYIQPNEVACARGPHGFPTDHGSNLTFGAISGYPCCAVNGHYAWPLLSQRLFYATDDGGLAAAVYGPCEARVHVAGKDVTVREETRYPFQGRVAFTFVAAPSLAFPLRLRIPSWCPHARVTVNGETQAAPVAGTFFTLRRPWKTGDRVTVEFPMDLRVAKRKDGGVVVERGPLLYALAVREDWRKIPHPPDLHGPLTAKYPSYEVLPKGDWNLALALDPANPAESLQVGERSSASAQPFSPSGAPVWIRAKARKIPSWGLNAWGIAEPPPARLVPQGAEISVTLLPFGCTRLRVTYLPTLGD